MTDERVGRIRFMDEQRVNLDGFAHEDVDLGLVAMAQPARPRALPGPAGRTGRRDGRPERRADFDALDALIAAHGIDLSVAEEAMALDDVAFARLFVDFAVPRAEVVRLVAGTTPAKLARVVALLRPAELTMAMTKMRARRTPSNQAHVTNRLDDPLLLAADAATAAAYGFREIETTVPVLADAPSNAVAVTIGSAIASPGVLVQCSVEEAMELEMGIRGLVSYAETVSLYGTESVFVDGDDTPYSKAVLAAAYASRGVKMRVSSGAGAEVLMGGAEQCSMLYLESRCVSLARAMGVQGVQNGGIDGASVAGVRAPRRPRADGRERHGDGPQPRGVHRQRRADVGVRRTPYLAHAADPARRQRLRVQRLRQHPALRQHVRPVAVERRGLRRLAGDAA